MTRPPDDSPIDDDPGPLVRPFATTRGRTGTNVHDLDIFTLVTAVEFDNDIENFDREYRQILSLCGGRPQSIAEIAARCGLLVTAAKVLVGDLITAGYIEFRSPHPDVGHDPVFLRAVLAGLRKL
ncbi:DUF742 domain-containing protein [Nocardia sp. AB354]|uniref:DUF742 domain-containing protein n=1 Tax=Nocardia sp. AB354 TaxID=3413283 RepID=UPI003C274C46